MPKQFHPQALTANDLMEGDAVWWTGAAWSPDPAAALIAETEAAADALARLAEDPAQQGAVVGPYLVPLTIAEDTLRPISRRERIRMEGAPTFAYAPVEPDRRAA